MLSKCQTPPGLWLFLLIEPKPALLIWLPHFLAPSFWNGIFATGDWRAQRGLKTISPRRDFYELDPGQRRRRRRASACPMAITRHDWLLTGSAAWMGFLVGLLVGWIVFGW
jgi:hypothetical protein